MLNPLLIPFHRQQYKDLQSQIKYLDYKLERRYSHELWLKQQRLKAKRDGIGCILAGNIPLIGPPIAIVGAGITCLRHRKAF